MNRTRKSLTFGHARLAEYSLMEGVVHVNHGSYGAVPNAVAEAQARWRAEVEANPSRFFRTRHHDLVRAGAARVAALLGGEGVDWVFVDNATAAANIVAASLPLARGDEILTTDQVYGAVRKALRHHAARCGARLVEAQLPVPIRAEEDIIEAVARAVTSRTKAAVIDHVASQSAVVFPVARLADLLRRSGIPVLVDGAHAPGMLELDVPALGVDWYFGNAHKWLGAPRGCGLLWCRRDRQAALHPLVISHGYGQGFTAEFDWAGTRDPSPWLSVTAAIDYHQSRGGPALRRRNHELAVAAGERLAASFGTESSAPPELLGSMATVRLPTERAAVYEETERLQVELEKRHDVEASLVPLGGRHWLRISASIYNEMADFAVAGRAAAALMEFAPDAR